MRTREGTGEISAEMAVPGSGVCWRLQSIVTVGRRVSGRLVYVRHVDVERRNERLENWIQRGVCAILNTHSDACSVRLNCALPSWGWGALVTAARWG